MNSALDDPPYFGVAVSWNAKRAHDDIVRSGADPVELLADVERQLTPTDHDWLADRLTVLWKSSTPARSLDATTWLHETGRLLADLPQSILAPAIDEAVRTAGDDFMPGVGSIRKIAEPKADALRRQHERLRLAVRAGTVEQPANPDDSEGVGGIVAGLAASWRTRA